MTRQPALIACESGGAAAEIVLVLPLLLTLMFGSVELGNYFYNEHILVKAVRDGARFAARQDIANFTGCSGDPGGTVKSDTQNIVRTGLLSGGSGLISNFSTSDVTVSVSCSTSAGASTVAGIYTNVKNSSGSAVGAPIVTVSAKVNYTSLFNSAFGFRGLNYKMNASQQAAVSGW